MLDVPSAAGRNRRGFLHGLLSCAGAAAMSPLIARAAAAPTRALSFVHTHTGERLKVTYCCDGVYQPDSLKEVNHLLRDFRSGDVHAIDPLLLDTLYGLQSATGHNGRYEVICGYRSPGTNAMLHERSSGVATHSLHMQGQAIDIRMSGYSTERLHELALNLRQGGVGYYPGSDFVHVDTGRVRAWRG